MAEFEEDLTIELTATADPGSEFREWTGPCSGAEALCEVTMSEATEVTARFSHTRPTLTVDKAGGGTVGSTPKGIYCAMACPQVVAQYYKGTAVVLTAKAPTGVEFAEWEGCNVLAQTALESTCEVTLTSAKAVKATFTPAVKALVNPQTLTVSKAGTGTGTVKAAGLACQAACASTKVAYYGGVIEPKPKTAAAVTLVATPTVGSDPVQWENCEAEPEGKCVVSMSKARSVTARFEE